MRIQVFIPAFNEEGSIGGVVERVRALYPSLEVIVIDDGSVDGTGSVARRSGATVVRHLVNLGGGAAVRTAFSLASIKGSDYAITFDGDGQHDPSELSRFLDVIEREAPDVVIGTRFYEGGRIVMRGYRRYGIKFFSLFFSWLTKLELTDVTNCYRAYKVSAVKEVLGDLREDQYYAIEILGKVAGIGGKIVEVPVSDIMRTKGNSKKGIVSYFLNLSRVLLAGV